MPTECACASFVCRAQGFVKAEEDDLAVDEEGHDSRREPEQDDGLVAQRQALLGEHDQGLAHVYSLGVRCVGGG